jgi:hypothetical protein
MTLRSDARVRQQYQDGECPLGGNCACGVCTRHEWMKSSVEERKKRLGTESLLAERDAEIVRLKAELRDAKRAETREMAARDAAESALATLQAAVRDYFETFDGERGDESQAAFLGAEERLRALVPDAEEGTKP